MAKFTIEYTVTEVTRQRIVIEADSVEEAIEAVETYEFDNSDQWQVDSLQWSIDNVEAVA